MDHFHREPKSRPFRWTSWWPCFRKLCIVVNGGETNEVFDPVWIVTWITHIKIWLFTLRKSQFVIKRTKKYINLKITQPECRLVSCSFISIARRTNKLLFHMSAVVNMTSFIVMFIFFLYLFCAKLAAMLVLLTSVDRDDVVHWAV